MEIYFAGELLRRMLVRASPIYKICLVAYCAAPCTSSRKSEFPEVFST